MTYSCPSKSRAKKRRGTVSNQPYSWLINTFRLQARTISTSRITRHRELANDDYIANRMQVLIPHATGGNLYIQELGHAYSKLGCEVVFGADNLLQQQLLPDLVHLNWPEEMYRWRNDLSLDARVTRFLTSINRLRKARVPVAFTVHNLAPHDFPNDPIDLKVYQEVINECSVIHHHCSTSERLLKSKYSIPESRVQVVAPHGHYLSYPNTIDRGAARIALGIPTDAIVFLQFGLIRGYKGLGALISSFDSCRVQEKFLLIAGEYHAPAGLEGIKQRLRLKLRKSLHANFKLVGQAIPSDHVQTYLNAADCLVMTHTAGLNSGVAVLGMTFGLQVIGPRLGCIESVLANGHNIIYSTGQVDEIARAMENVAMQTGEERQFASQENKRIAAGWQWTDIASQVMASVALIEGASAAS